MQTYPEVSKHQYPKHANPRRPLNTQPHPSYHHLKMDITHSLVRQGRSGSRSRTRNSTANSRSTSASRRPSLNGSRRSLSASLLNKLVITPTTIDFSSDKTIPTIHVNLDNTLPLDFFKQELIGLIKRLRISKWYRHQLTVANLGVTRISGALTNSIYKLEYSDEAAEVVLPLLLLRVYGKNVDNLIDRDGELRTLIKLSANKIGPKLLGIFSNGRFEQFLEGFVTLGKEDIRNPVISQMLGRRMKDLHYKINLDEHERSLEFPEVWLQITKWILIFERDFLPHMSPQVLQDTLLMPWDKFRHLALMYRDWLLSKYDYERLQENYRFCHNDTQYGNLLIKEDFDPKEVIRGTSEGLPLSTSSKRDYELAVIDFEYFGANFPAYDIADHFSEWMSDYHNPAQSYFIHEGRYPTQSEQLNLLKSYVEYDFQSQSSNLKTKLQVSAQDDFVTAVEFEVKKLYNETVYWRASVQFFWLVWGLIQSGPAKDPMDEIMLRSEEQGVEGTYEFSTGVETLSIKDDTLAADDEAITSVDDDFDYLKYAQQKAALIAGDLISFGLLDKASIDARYQNIIKFLDTTTFEI